MRKGSINLTSNSERLNNSEGQSRKISMTKNAGGGDDVLQADLAVDSVRGEVISLDLKTGLELRDKCGWKCNL